MKFAVYSRKSKFTGKGESIVNQAELCRAYLQNNFEDISDSDLIYYEDEGFSGKTLDRPEFQRLLKDARLHKFNYIVCYRLDRISRSVVDFSSLVELFSKLEIGFICIREQFDTSTPMGRAMMYIASVFAQLERETIAERVRDNMLLLAKDGRWLGGTPPFGFCSCKREAVIVDGKRKNSFILENKPEEEAIVREIFRLFLSGKKLIEIKEILNRQRAHTRNGNLFSIPGIRAILRNPVYAAADQESCLFLSSQGAEVPFKTPKFTNTGLLCYHKRSGISGTEKNCPPSEWIIAQGAHRCLISGQDWVTVQKLLSFQKQKIKKSSYNGYALLSGKLVCGRCGEKFYPKPRSSRSDDSFDYICSNKLHGSLCNCPNLNGIKADSLIRKIFSPLPLFSEINRILKKTYKKNLLEVSAPLPNGLVKSASQINILPKEEKIFLEQLTLPNIIGKSILDNILLHPSKWLSSMPLPEQRRLLDLLLERVEWDGSRLNLICRPGFGSCFSENSVSFSETADFQH